MLHICKTDVYVPCVRAISIISYLFRWQYTLLKRPALLSGKSNAAQKSQNVTDLPTISSTAFSVYTDVNMVRSLCICVHVSAVSRQHRCISIFAIRWK